MATKYTTPDGPAPYASTAMLDFMDACAHVRAALEQLSPKEFHFKEGQPVDAFACRMAASGYRAIAAGLEEAAFEAEQADRR
jgi:hypothetical protein